MDITSNVIWLSTLGVNLLFIRKETPVENPEIVYWKIYYPNGKTFSSKQGKWAQAPNKNVQIVLLWRKDKNSRILRGRDYYFYDPLALLYTFGQTNNLLDIPTTAQVKKGSWLSDAAFWKILWEALLDVRALYYPLRYPRPDIPGSYWPPG